jgi:uncharacterized protein (DUF849 family)
MADPKPCIICVAITGSLPTKANNPAVPITVDEQVESTHEAFEAGATIMHAHVRNADQTPSSDPEKFARLKEGMEKHCPGMIIQFSTGGRSGSGKERGGMLPLRPDMASLSVGSNNFPNRVYENRPISSIGWPVKCAPMTSNRRSRPSTFPTSSGGEDACRGQDQGHALHSVRDGREECHARRPRRVRLLRLVDMPARGWKTTFGSIERRWHRRTQRW